jgi:hypothetical protein
MRREFIKIVQGWMMDHSSRTAERRLERARAWSEANQPLADDEAAVLDRMEHARAAVIAYRKQQAGQEEAVSG